MYKKFLFGFVILALLVFISQKNHLSFFTKTDSHKKHSAEDVLDDFVAHAMIRENAVYTLFGLKPVTAIYADPILAKDKNAWEKFKKQLESLEIKEYIFSELYFKFDGSILFVHVPFLLYTLNKYHDQFKQELGMDFDSMRMIEELRGEQSVFWDKIFKEKNHYLMGLIFGFGEKNSRYFQLEREKKICIKKVNHLSTSDIQKLKKEHVSIEDVCFPWFISYQIEDEVLEGYKKKRKKIVQYLKGKDLSKEVLSLLESKEIDLTGAQKTWVPYEAKKK